MMPMFDPLSMMLLLPAVLLAIYAQSKVQSSFARYSEIYASRGVSAEVVSRRLLDNFGLQNVRIVFLPSTIGLEVIICCES